MHNTSYSFKIDLPSLQGSDVAAACLELARQPDRMAEMAASARATAAAYSLEAWQQLIGERLESAWGRLQSSSPP